MPGTGISCPEGVITLFGEQRVSRLKEAPAQLPPSLEGHSAPLGGFFFDVSIGFEIDVDFLFISQVLEQMAVPRHPDSGKINAF